MHGRLQKCVFTAHKCILRNVFRISNSNHSWFLDTASVFSTYIAVHLVGDIIFVAIVAFQFDMQLRHLEFNICLVAVSGSVGLSNLFVHCYFGKLATTSFLQMADSLYDSNWLNISVRLQKHVLLMIENTQRPLQYHGFHVAYLDLETFSKMINTIFKMYMLVKAVTA